MYKIFPDPSLKFPKTKLQKSQNSSTMRRRMDPDRKIYIGGLPDDANKFDVEDAFARIGRVTDVWVARSPPGFAFLEMEDKRDAEDACRELDGTRICGNRVEVKMSRDGGRGVGGGSMRRSRSPIRRRSRSRSRSGGRQKRSPSCRSMSRERRRSRSRSRRRSSSRRSRS